MMKNSLLKDIYKASDCTDFVDVEMNIKDVHRKLELVRSNKNGRNSLYARLGSLVKRRSFFLKNPSVALKKTSPEWCSSTPFRPVPFCFHSLT